MNGFDCLGTDEVGFDYMSLVKGGAGLLSGAGQMLSEGDKGGTTAAALIEKQHLQDEKERAERSAATLKTVLIVTGSLVGVGALAALFAAGRK